jgi:parallel beta-helix repeat protein
MGIGFRVDPLVLGLVAILYSGCDFPQNAGVVAKAGGSALLLSTESASIPDSGPSPEPSPAPSADPSPEPTGSGVGYYFSTAQGVDTRTAAEARNPATPWKTIAKLNSISGMLEPGDSVLFKRGETFSGSILPTKSGATGTPIRYGAYGTGEKPVISGLTRLSGWTNVGGGVYRAPCPACKIGLNTVLIDGRPIPMGRWPNADAPGGGFRKVTSHVGYTSITDSGLSASPNWTGAELVLRANRYTYERDPITSHSGTRITYTSVSHYETADGFGYFIQNHPATLDQLGEWYFEPSGKSLEMYFGSNDPAGYVVEASTVDTLFDSGASNELTVDGLAFRGANAKAVSITSVGVTIANSDILFTGGQAVFAASPARAVKLDGLHIEHTGDIGINLHANDSVIRKSAILSSGTVPGMGGHGKGRAYEGVEVSGNGNLVEFNVIKDSGYLALAFDGDLVTIRNNFIDHFCFVKDDGGGIYTYGDFPHPAYVNRQILNNIVLNGVGAPIGTNSAGSETAEGIYLDDGTTNVEVAGNTVAHNSDKGIFIHNSHEIKVHDNVSFDNTKQLGFQQDLTPNLIQNVVITRNVFVAQANQLAFFYLNGADLPANAFGKSDYNIFARPIDDANDFFWTAPRIASQITASFAGWRSYSGFDSHSTGSPKPIANASDLRFEYNSTEAPKTVFLGGNYVGMDGVPYSGSVTLAPFTSIILVKN